MRSLAGNMGYQNAENSNKANNGDRENSGCALRGWCSGALGKFLGGWRQMLIYIGGRGFGVE